LCGFWLPPFFSVRAVAEIPAAVVLVELAGVQAAQAEVQEGAAAVVQAVGVPAAAEAVFRCSRMFSF